MYTKDLRGIIKSFGRKLRSYARTGKKWKIIQFQSVKVEEKKIKDQKCSVLFFTFWWSHNSIRLDLTKRFPTIQKITHNPLFGNRWTRNPRQTFDVFYLIICNYLWDNTGTVDTRCFRVHSNKCLKDEHTSGKK